MKFCKKKFWAALAVLMTAVFLVGCGSENNGENGDEAGEGSYDTLSLSAVVADVQSIVVDHINNNVDVRVHDGSNIEVTFTPPTDGNYVRAVLELREGRLFAGDYPPDTVGTIRNGRGGHLQILLPRGVALDFIEIELVNGNIDLNGGGVTLADVMNTNSVNGNIFIAGLQSGRAETETVNGGITLRDLIIDGRLTATTVLGNISLINVDADMDQAVLSTVLGRIEIRD